MFERERGFEDQIWKRKEEIEAGKTPTLPIDVLCSVALADSASYGNIPWYLS